MEEPNRVDDVHNTTIFSPFGLGILDLAVSKLVRDLAHATDSGTVVPSFLPDSWTGHSANGAKYV